eukprot:365490-Chlamydomonas_euryale.AAC.8
MRGLVWSLVVDRKVWSRQARVVCQLLEAAVFMMNTAPSAPAPSQQTSSSSSSSISSSSSTPARAFRAAHEHHFCPPPLRLQQVDIFFHTSTQCPGGAHPPPTPAARARRPGLPQVNMFLGARHGQTAGLHGYESPPLRDSQLVLIAFDCLLMDGIDLTQRPLSARHDALRETLGPCAPAGIPLAGTGTTGVAGRLLPLLPNVPLMRLGSNGGGGGDCFSRLSSSLDEVRAMYQWAVDVANVRVCATFPFFRGAQLGHGSTLRATIKQPCLAVRAGV